MTCRTCNVPVVPPFCYCDAHAPAHRATAHKSYMLHRAERLAYQHAHNAKPAVVNGPCPVCGATVPSYSGRNRARTFCSERCRNRANDRKRVPRHRTAKVAP